ncbi:MAG TPA: IS630 family transposase [Gemmatimonadaceae bacterium]|nr:IS630 family transposase [Gemmatimonadaceae bacterium]
MFTAPMELTLTAAERDDLERVVRATTTPAGIARRARCILLLADGHSYSAVCTALAVTDRFVARWKRRFVDGGVLALADDARAGRQDHRLSPAVEARILRITREEPPPTPLTHWTSRRLAARVGVSNWTVLQVWRRAGLKPHRLERYVTTTDPEFERKAADVIALYLEPPEHAVVLCVDEKTAIQALDRVDPVLPLSPGRAERHGFEYYRHGTLSLYAALEVATGRVAGMPAARHTSADFLAFMDRVVGQYRRRQELHVILDNLSAHKTKAVRAWQATHPHVHFHFTPTYSSWLNQVELWFAKIERDVIARGIFTSVPDLRKKLLQYIKLHNKTAQPFRWIYDNPSRRVRAIRN